MAKVILTSKSSAMKSTLPLLSLALIFASCSTAYKSGQTPDDVYFSPLRPQDEYVHKEKKEEPKYSYDDEAYRDDRYLRMKIRDRRYVGLYDDYYSYNPYYYHYINGSLYYNSPFNSYSYWNYYYNPNCSHVIAVTPKAPVVHKPRTFDLSVYNPQPTNPKARTYSSSSSSSNNYGTQSANNYRNSGTNAGNFLRDVFSGSGNSGSSSSSGSSTRSSSSSSSSSSGSTSSGSSGGGSTNAPARRF
jgi:hypothetical protein